MRELYYSDKRDLVKWGVLVELAARHRVRHILQVLYYRPTVWPDLEIDGLRVALPDVVVRHFRDLKTICGLECHATVDVVDEPFGDRRTYLELVLDRLRSRSESPGIVFLDPDTGLAPRSAGPEHVLESELAAIWRALPLGDLLVFYQHQTNRNGEPWIQPKKAQFQRAVGLRSDDVGIGQAPQIASDVVFFFAQKMAGPAAPESEDLGGAAMEQPTAEPMTVESKLPVGSLEEVLACLNATKTRATYGAVAAIVGGLARGIGQRLGFRRPEASWVVSSDTGLPSGYEPDQIHPDLFSAPIIRTGRELHALLERWKAG